MIRLLETMKNYDKDRSMRLSKSEIDPFFRDHFPSHAAVYEQLIRELFPQVITTTRDGSQGHFSEKSIVYVESPFRRCLPNVSAPDCLFAPCSLLSAQGTELSFRNLLLLIYAVLCKAPGCRPIPIFLKQQQLL
jgi:hypothetical protein